jgi:hypothetical protein
VAVVAKRRLTYAAPSVTVHLYAQSQPFCSGLAGMVNVVKL